MSLLPEGARVNFGVAEDIKVSRVVAADINKSRRLGSHDAIRRIRESWNLTLTSTGSSDPIPLGRGTREQRDRGSEYPSTRGSILIHLLLGLFDPRYDVGTCRSDRWCTIFFQYKMNENYISIFKTWNYLIASFWKMNLF